MVPAVEKQSIGRAAALGAVRHPGEPALQPREPREVVPMPAEDRDAHEVGLDRRQVARLASTQISDEVQEAREHDSGRRVVGLDLRRQRVRERLAEDRGPVDRDLEEVAARERPLAVQRVDGREQEVAAHAAIGFGHVAAQQTHVGSD